MPSLYVLDVGHGNSTVLKDTAGTIVVDAGPKSGLLDFLTSHEIYEIDVLLLSHADMDHIGGAIALLMSDEIKIKKVYLNQDSTKSSSAWNDLLYALYNTHKSGDLIFEPALTTHLSGKLNQGMVNVEIMAPNQYIVSKGPGSTDNKGRKLTTNSISAVIRLSCEQNHVALLPGDIDQIGLDNLFQDHDDARSWLLVYPHHGGRPGKGNVNEFINILCRKVSPEIVVFSIRDNLQDYPNREVVETVARSLDKVCMLTTRSSDVLLDYIKQTESGLHKDCVGHVRLDLDSFPPCINFEGSN